jgi:opacity protein-like surface antigen
MKDLFLGSIALLVVSVGVSARAAEMPVKAPLAAPLYNWSGFYFGANFGGAWTSGSLNIPGNNFYGGIGNQHVSAYVSGYYSVIRPDALPDWQLRTEFTLLFPEK